jgi:hypothetical protein
VRTSILLWSAASGLLLGFFAGVMGFAILIVGGELLPGVIPRLGTRGKLVAAIISFAVLPLAGATLGWLEGRLKLR